MRFEPGLLRMVSGLVPFIKIEEMAVEACGKRVVCVFQGAVDAFCASTAPAASTAQTRGHDE